MADRYGCAKAGMPASTLRKRGGRRRGTCSLALRTMNLRRLALAIAIAASIGIVAPRAASAGIGGHSVRDVNTASRELPRTPPIVPAVIVLAAIGTAVVRINRRGGPR